MDGFTARLNARQRNIRLLALAGSALLILLLLNIPAIKRIVHDDPAGASESNPLVGDENNDDPVFEKVQNWRELVQTVEAQDAEWYKQCMSDRIGVSWEDAQRYAELVDQGHDLRFILVSNSSISDEQARQELRDSGKGYDDVDKLPIQRVADFRNTRGLPTDKCQSFGDSRHQVRVSLAIPKDVDAIAKMESDKRLTMEDFVPNKGVLSMCGNPWDLVSSPPPPDTAPPGTQPPTHNPPPTSPPNTTPTTVCPKPRKPASTIEYQWEWHQEECRWVKIPNRSSQDGSGITTPTPGAGVEPTPSPRGPDPVEGTPAPDPNPGGYDSGTPDGTRTPGGSTCDTNGCTGGGPRPPSGPPVTVDTGDHTSDPGGF